MRIASITPHQLLNNPRIVREADALAAAGHDVRVIAVRNDAAQSAFSDAIGRGRRWRLDTVSITRAPQDRRRWLVTGARQKTARALWRRVRTGRWVAGAAYCRTFSETMRLIGQDAPDLIIAHTQPMLAAAYFAAAHLNCRWAFDCEDVLSEELGEGVDDPAHRELVQYVERAFIPAAAYVTTASPEFGPWLTDRYGVVEPTYVANVPSLAEAPEAVRAGYPDARPHLSLYWFSISIGPLRGVEDAVRALPHLGVPARLHLRGRMLPGFDRDLRTLVDSLGVQDRVFVHDLAAPGDVVRAAADHDIGLVLMQPCCDNHEMAVPNKLYAYMMAGLAVGSTTTRGLTGVVAGMGDVGFQYAPGNHLQLAARINDLAADPRRLHAARAEAFRLAQTRYNWEREQQRLVSVVDRLPRHSPAAPVLNPAET